MELELITGLSSLGVGAIFGVTVFLMYRADRKSSEERFEKLCQHHDKKWESLVIADQKTRQDNTKALTQLTMVLDKMSSNGKSPQ